MLCQHSPIPHEFGHRLDYSEEAPVNGLDELNWMHSGDQHFNPFYGRSDSAHPRQNPLIEACATCVNLRISLNANNNKLRSSILGGLAEIHFPALRRWEWQPVNFQNTIALQVLRVYQSCIPDIVAAIGTLNTILLVYATINSSIFDLFPRTP